MTFPWILQRYIFREMGKTFLLAVVALTGVTGLGGGVLNMMKLGEVTPGQLVRLMALVLPLAAALTLPIAALFGATATYGRLSADNEFVACGSSGINLHVLFLPTVVLSLVAAGVSFTLTNYLVPGMVRNLNEFVGADVGALIRQRLHQPKGIALGDKYRLYADRSVVHASNTGRVTLQRIAFVEIDGGQWVRYGTARDVDLVFDRVESRLQVSGRMRGLSYYDRKLGAFFEEAEQAIPPNDLPVAVPQRIKFLTLRQLLHFWSKPTQWGEVRRKLRRLRKAFGAHLVYESLADDFRDDQELTLSDGNVSYRVRSQSGGLIGGDRGLELTDVTVEERRPGGARTITAERANLEITRGRALAESGIRIELYHARAHDGIGRAAPARMVLGPLPIDRRLVDRVSAMTDDQLLEGSHEGPGDPVSQKREAARRQRADTVRRIVGVIHERTAFSVSVFVLVILGAALGIVFRGSHVMTAFGISVVPALVVIVAIVTGKQMSHNAPTHVAGLLVMWGGIAGVAGFDAWTLIRLLRR